MCICVEEGLSVGLASFIHFHHSYMQILVLVSKASWVPAYPIMKLPSHYWEDITQVSEVTASPFLLYLKDTLSLVLLEEEMEFN